MNIKILIGNIKQYTTLWHFWNKIRVIYKPIFSSIILF